MNSHATIKYFKTLKLSKITFYGCICSFELMSNDLLRKPLHFLRHLTFRYGRHRKHHNSSQPFKRHHFYRHLIKIYIRNKNRKLCRRLWDIVITNYATNKLYSFVYIDDICKYWNIFHVALLWDKRIVIGKASFATNLYIFCIHQSFVQIVLFTCFSLFKG